MNTFYIENIDLFHPHTNADSFISANDFLTISTNDDNIESLLPILLHTINITTTTTNKLMMPHLFPFHLLATLFIALFVT